jgi:hypothetical protein
MTIYKFKWKNLVIISILTILFVIFLTAHAHASATTDENVKVIQSSGSIGINERVQFNGFTVKAHEFHNDTVSLAIYKNDNFVELFDFYENESRQYENIWIEVFKIEESSALVAISINDIRTVWTELKPAHALWGDYIQKDIYGIQIISFTDNSVTLGIFVNGNELVEETYNPNNENVYLDDFKIYVSNIDKNGNVDLRFFKKMPLDIRSIIKTKKDVYKPDEAVNCEVEIFNSGNTTINLADVKLTTEPVGKILIPRYQVNNLPPNQTQILEFPLAYVAENEDETIKINAEITLIDYFGKRYTFTVSKNIYISSGVGVMKDVVPQELEFYSDSHAESNVALIKLNVFNVGGTGKNVMIYDSIPDNVRLYNSSSLEWNKEVAPGGVVNINYYVIPDIPGEYTFPPAEVFVDDKTVYSTEVLFKVHGPLISIDKIASIEDDRIQVTNYIENEGDRAAYVIVIDNISQDSVIINGSEFWTDVMQPGESGQFNYSIQYPGELDKLPGASVQYQDIKGDQWHFESNPVFLSPDDFNSEILKKELFEFLLSSYLILLLVIGTTMIAIGFVIYTQSR